MVGINEINEALKKLKTNPEKISYLKGILENINDKKLKEEINKLIEDLRELEEVSQIETKGRVQWSVPEEPVEERRVNEQFMGNLKNDHENEPMRYQGNKDDSRGYASLSEELHEKEKKKPRF